MNESVNELITEVFVEVPGFAKQTSLTVGLIKYHFTAVAFRMNLILKVVDVMFR